MNKKKRKKLIKEIIKRNLYTIGLAISMVSQAKALANYETINTDIIASIEQDEDTNTKTAAQSISSGSSIITIGELICEPIDDDFLDTSETKIETENVETTSYTDEYETPSIEETTNDVEEPTTNSNHIYYNYPCSTDLQECIYQVAEENNLPVEIFMVIIDQESNGKWNTNGVISPSGDYGLCQINECNLKYINETLGYSKDEILNDEYKNLEASALIIKNIFKEYGYSMEDFEYENVFGTYNGWVDWRSISGSVKYAETCMERLNNMEVLSSDYHK